MDRGAEHYARFLSGDDEAFVALIRLYRDGLLLYINGYVHDMSLAEELTEDVFFDLLVKKPRYTSKSSFKTWLYTMGRNRTLNHLKRAARVFLADDEVLTAVADEESTEGAYLKKERDERLHKAMARLNAAYREALYLSYFESLKNEEIARVMGVSRRRVETLLYRGRLTLKKELEKEGFVYEEL